MSVKLRNAANDSSVTLIDGGAAGAPVITIDARAFVSAIYTSPDGTKWVLEVDNAGVITAVVKP